MSTEKQICRILQLSDCTMMCILSYLDATSLFNLSRTCQYLKNIVEDPKLWRYIEGRHEPNSTKKVQYVCDRIHDRTTHLFLRAESKYNGLVHQDVLVGWNRLEHLAILALENQRFDGGSLTLQDFPRTLVELSLKKTYVKNGKLFFQSSFLTMRNLRVLILDECEWVDSNFFMSVAKYENLEILSIIKCMKLHLNVIPYLNVARHGCKKLKIIDCRFNTVANEILAHLHKTLLALYFQSMSSYQLDMGRPLIKYPPMTVECRDLISQSTIKNRSLERYKYINGDLVEELPYSILYQDPYPECSCGWRNKANDPAEILKEHSESKQESHSMLVDDYIDFTPSPQRFICRRHIKELNRLPKEIKNFFYQNQKKFYPDSSDNESDSDDDRDCCMFGMNRSQQMIVLKVREVDEQGNLPEPQVIDIFRPGEHVFNIDVSPDSPEYRPRNIEPEPQPSTSRAGEFRDTHRSPMKRKAEDDCRENDKRRMRIDGDDSSPKAGGSQNIDNGTASGISNNSRVPSRIEPPLDRPGPSGQRLHPDQVNGGSRLAEALRRNWEIHQPVRPLRSERYRVLLEGISPRENQEKIKLRRLSLRGYREITDEGLNYIRNLNLDLLDVTYTGVTRKGVEKFLTVNPNCRVVHPNYCVCKPRISC